MISNAPDLETFYRALMAGQLLKPAQQQQLRTIVPKNLGVAGAGLDQPSTPSATGTPSTTTVPAAKPSTTATIGRLGAFAPDEDQDTQHTTGADDTPAPDEQQAPDDTNDTTAPGEQGTPAGDGPSTTVAPSTAPSTTHPAAPVPGATVPGTTVPGPSASDLPEGYGLGIEHVHMSCAMAWGHSGSADGYASETLVSEDGTRDVAFATNGNWRPPDGFIDQIREVLDIALCSNATSPTQQTTPNPTTTDSQIAGLPTTGEPNLTNRSPQTDP